MESGHQFIDSKAGQWELKAPFPIACNHVAGVSTGTKLYTFGGFLEQNRCPHSKCFVYHTATAQWAPIAGLARPRGAISAGVLDGKVHLLGGRRPICRALIAFHCRIESSRH